MFDSHVRVQPVDARFERCHDVGRPDWRFDVDVALPDIARPARASAYLLWLPFLSGVLSTAAFWCGQFGFQWGPGLVFAVVVVLPWCVSARVHPVVAVLAIFLTPLAYHLAVQCFFADFGGMLCAGAAGAGLMLAPLIVFGPAGTRLGLCGAVVVGWAAGFPFLCMFGAYFGLIGLWQFAVGATMMMALLGGHRRFVDSVSDPE